MVAPRKSELEHDSGSETDDSPEEVTLSLGREKAQELIKEERENQKRVHAEAKQRRQRKIVKKAGIPSDKQEDSPASAEEAGTNPALDDDEFKHSKSAKISGFLDASIIDFLAAQERKSGEASASPPEDEIIQPRKSTGKRKGNKEITSSSRVKVVLLTGDRPSSANYQNALEFKQKRLYGEGVHRSLNMLTTKR